MTIGDYGVEDSIRIYGIHNWGQGYFDVDAKGHLVVRPTKDADKAVSLPDIVQGLRQKKVGFPALVRFPQIL